MYLKMINWKRNFLVYRNVFKIFLRCCCPNTLITIFILNIFFYTKIILTIKKPVLFLICILINNNFKSFSGFGMQSSESKGRRAAAQSAQSEGSSSSELDDQIEKDRYLSSVSCFGILLIRFDLLDFYLSSVSLFGGISDCIVEMLLLLFMYFTYSKLHKFIKKTLFFIHFCFI